MKRRLNPLILVGTGITAVAAGVVWYMEPVLGGLRMDRLGIPRVGAVIPSPAFLLLKLTLALLGAYLLAGLVARLGVTGFAAGARVGLAVGLISVTLSFDSAQAGQPLGLILTDGIFMVLVASLMGAVLAKAHGQQRGEEK